MPFDILLVDDSQPDAQIFEFAVQEARARARVYWVSSGKEALDFLYNRGRFEEMGGVELVLLDLNLPGENGFSVLRSIKSDPDLTRKPVIVLSSSNAQDDIDLAYSLGANAYFRKPMSLELYVELLRVIAAHWLDLVRLPTKSRNSDRSALSRQRARYNLDES